MPCRAAGCCDGSNGMAWPDQMPLLWPRVHGTLATDTEVCQLRWLALQPSSSARSLHTAGVAGPPMQAVYQHDDPQFWTPLGPCGDRNGDRHGDRHLRKMQAVTGMGTINGHWESRRGDPEQGTPQRL